MRKKITNMYPTTLEWQTICLSLESILVGETVKKTKKLLPEDDYHETQTILPYHHDKSLAAAGGTVAGSAWSRPREGPRTARRLELLACGLRGVRQPVWGVACEIASSCISVWKEYPNNFQTMES